MSWLTNMKGSLYMNKELEDFMSMHYPAVISGNLDEGYHASLMDIPACSATGRTLQELMSNLDAAKRKWFQNAIASGTEIPEPRKKNKHTL